MPFGRCGCANGSSPAAMRSVHSANSLIARSPSSRLMSRAMSAIAPPDFRRRRQASTELPSASFIQCSGTVRVPGVPSAWQDWQAPVLMLLSHWPWLATGPSGNSLASGTRRSENQYSAG